MVIDASDVEYTHLLLEENFNTLYQRCLTPDQKKHLCDLYSAARYASWKVARQRPADSSVSGDLKMTNMQLATILQNSGDIGEFLILAAEAVRLAAALVPTPADAC
jgi:hypothetical protein